MKWVCVAAAALSLCAGGASAALVQVTYTGTATGGDGLGLFGTGLIDVPFLNTYLFNESADYGAPGALLGANVTINGSSYAIPTLGSVGGDAVVPDFFRESSVLYIKNRTPGDFTYTWLALGNALQSPDTPDARDIAYTATGMNPTNLSGHANTLIINAYTDHFTGGFFRFNTTAVTVTTVAAPPPLSGRVGVAAVPEPATWAFLILGMGAVGAALRRRPRPANA
jgi:hypothetical protein